MRLTALAVVAGAVWAGLAGCGHAESDVPKAEIKTVEAYGVTLGPEASPQEVVFVLLRSIADDYAAAKAKDHAAQKSAQELTFSVAAVNTIERRMVESAKQFNPNLKKNDLGDERDAKIFKTVHYWGPIIGHYVPTFAQVELETLKRDTWVSIAPSGRNASVFYPVAHDPAAEPAKSQTATIEVELVREAAASGGAEYWRVARLQFLGRQFRAPSAPRIVQAYGMTLDESAGPEQVASVVLRSLVELLAADKAGAQDARASALYRLFNLAQASRVMPRVALKDQEDATAETLGTATAVAEWARAVAPAFDALKEPSKSAPEQMRATAAGDTVRVACAAAGLETPITVDLAREQADGKALWRVFKVSGAPTAPAGTAAATATQPATPQ